MVPRGNSDSCHPDTANVHIGPDAPIASRQALSAGPGGGYYAVGNSTLPGNAGGDARMMMMLVRLRVLLSPM